MKISTKNASILIDVINKQLEITTLKLQNTDDLLEQNHLIILQGLRNEFENLPDILSFNILFLVLFSDCRNHLRQEFPSLLHHFHLYKYLMTSMIDWLFSRSYV